MYDLKSAGWVGTLGIACTFAWVVVGRIPWSSCLSLGETAGYHHLLAGKLSWLVKKQFIVDIPLEKNAILHSYVSLPKGIPPGVANFSQGHPLTSLTSACFCAASPVFDPRALIALPQPQRTWGATSEQGSWRWGQCQIQLLCSCASVWGKKTRIVHLVHLVHNSNAEESKHQLTTTWRFVPVKEHLVPLSLLSSVWVASTCGRFLARPGHLLLPADQTAPGLTEGASGHQILRLWMIVLTGSIGCPYWI